MDQQAYRSILDMPKDATVLGTYETSAFILSLKDRNEFSRLHPSGYHCIPHIGEDVHQNYLLNLQCDGDYQLIQIPCMVVLCTVPIWQPVMGVSYHLFPEKNPYQLHVSASKIIVGTLLSICLTQWYSVYNNINILIGRLYDVCIIYTCEDCA